MMGTCKTYSDEFRQEAVKLVTEQHLQRSQVARDLGIDPQTLRRWLRELAPTSQAVPAVADICLPSLLPSSPTIRLL
jgi:transposase-like protein